MYTLNWKNPALDVNKGTAIQVPVGTVVSNKAPIRFTGKGAANYGAIQQENLMRLVENFADSTSPPFPTVGLLWFDTANGLLQLCTSTSPLVYKSLSGIQITNVGSPAPINPVLGDMWFQRTGSSSGIFYVYTGVGRYPNTATNIGGWAQMWPQPVLVAGREEYEAVISLVYQLIGPASVGGNASNGKAIMNITDLNSMDASMRAAFLARTPLDPNVLTPTNETTGELMVDPNSNDWDVVLAAARYAINRLELPANYYDDISPVPFVQDGRQAPISLLALGSTDVRYPSLERRSGRNFGIITLSRLYSETVNVLSSALQNRYSLRGINGATGTNTTFASNVTVNHQASFSGALGGANNPSFTMRFQFASTTARDSFLNSGGAIQVILSLSGNTSSTADTEMKALLDQRGVFRLTADKTRIFANVLPYAQVVAPSQVGIQGAPVGGTTLTTQTVAGASCIVSASLPSATTFYVGIVLLSATGGMNGSWTISFDVIKDTETYMAPALTSVYGAPNAYVNGDKVSGTASVVYVG